MAEKCTGRGSFSSEHAGLPHPVFVAPYSPSMAAGRSFVLVMLLHAASACAGRQPKTASPASTIAEAPAAAPAVVFNPRAIGTITVLDLDLPAAGQVIGGHFEGVNYQARVSQLTMGELARRRWNRGIRESADSLLRVAGYSVRVQDEATSAAQPLRNVRFGLNAQLAVTVRTEGKVEPHRVVASVAASWELLDLANGAAVYAGDTRGGAQLDDSMDVAVNRAVTRSLQVLLADSSFQVALTTPRQRTLEDVVFEALWEKPLPGPDDTVWIDGADLNPALVTDPIQRVASGVLTIHGRRSLPTTAFAITRSGLAITAALPSREPRLWGRFHDGVERPVRIVRTRGGLNLLQVQCEDFCETVPWIDSLAVQHAARVFVVAGPIDRSQPFWVGNGRIYRSTSREREELNGFRLGVDDASGGEPVARPVDGLVFAVSMGNRAVPLSSAFKALGVALRPLP